MQIFVKTLTGKTITLEVMSIACMCSYIYEPIVALPFMHCFWSSISQIVKAYLSAPQSSGWLPVVAVLRGTNSGLSDDRFVRDGSPEFFLFCRWSLATPSKMSRPRSRTRKVGCCELSVALDCNSLLMYVRYTHFIAIIKPLYHVHILKIHFLAGRYSSGSAASDLRWQAARGWTYPVRLQHPEGVYSASSAETERRW